MSEDVRAAVPVDINSMFTETFNRYLDVKYAERINGEYRFLIASRKEDQVSNGTTHNTWLTESELDQLILNLVEAKVRYGRNV